MRVGPRRHRTVSFADGTLFLTGPHGEQAALRPWPPEARRRQGPDAPWELFSPSLNLGELVNVAGDVRQLSFSFPGADGVVNDWSAELSAWAAFLSRMPPALVQLVTTRFQGSDWALLTMVSECEGRGAMELMEHSPALALLIAKRAAFSSVAAVLSANQLVYMKQRDVLPLLGFQGSKAVVKALRKVVRAGLNVHTLSDLRTIVSKPDGLSTLGHLSAITPAAVELLMTPRFLARTAPSLLEDLVSHPSRADSVRVVAMLRTVLDASAAAEEDLGDQKFASVQALTAAYGEWRQVLESLGVAQRLDLGPPPVPEIRTPHVVIEPLANWHALFHEGRDNRNCILSYAERIAQSQGTIYAYRVLAPSRATLLVRRTDDGPPRYTIAEMSGHCGAVVDPSTREAVTCWLESRPWPAVPKAAPETLVCTDSRGQLVLPACGLLSESPLSDTAIESLLHLLLESRDPAMRTGIALTLSHFAKRNGHTVPALLALARADSGAPPQLRAIAAEGIARAAGANLMATLKGLARLEPDAAVRWQMAFAISRAELTLEPPPEPQPRRARRQHAV